MRGAVRADCVRTDLPRLDGTIEWQPFAGLSTPAKSTIDPAGTAAERTVAGRYRLSTLLGTGGMGAVWLARDEVLQRPVALKQLTNSQREEGSSALREARAAARISHSSVVRVHDVLPDEDGDWIVMEALPGKALSAIIREQGRLPAEEVMRIALHLLSALQEVHEVDLVHRDIKPSNVQLCDEDRVVLTDFGLTSPPSAIDGARSGAVTGSLPYLAPETILDGVYGPPSDLYALGVTLYEAVEGQQPFDTSTPLSVLDSAMSASPASAPHAGPLAVLLDGLLEKNPSLRMDASRARRYLQSMAPPPRGASTPAPAST
jgi:eukaryotic-like serine/threonine-protein kinase